MRGNFNRLKKEVGVHLSKSLREKYKKRSIRVRKGDEVEVIRGKFSGNSGVVEKVDLRKRRIYVEGIQVPKADGTKAKAGIVPSNTILTKLDLTDKKRKINAVKISLKKAKEEAKA